MESVQHFRKTDLARRTRQVLDAVQNGHTVIIETEGEPQVVMVDVIDYSILRAVMHYYTRHPSVDADAGLSDEAVGACAVPQARYNLVLAYYLEGAISLARAAELLDLSQPDLRARCVRLDVPLRAAPADLEEAGRDVETARAWSDPSVL